MSDQFYRLARNLRDPERTPLSWPDAAAAVENGGRDRGSAGKATFEFMSRYKQGATVTTGKTDFRFHAADFNFHSSEYDWLVLAGSDYARIKGTGTINGSRGYMFMIWAGDNDPDTFRIRTWEEDEFGVETVIYDNGMDQSIGRGNIVIHANSKRLFGQR